MIIVSNTTPIISFLKTEAQEIKECKFIKVVNVKNEFAVKLLQKNLGLDLGESEAIVLSDELNRNILIIDERKGRTVAKSMSINLTGTLGVLLKAKQQGIVDAIRPIIDKMMQKDIRISAALY